MIGTMLVTSAIWLLLVLAIGLLLVAIRWLNDAHTAAAPLIAALDAAEAGKPRYDIMRPAIPESCQRRHVGGLLSGSLSLACLILIALLAGSWNAVILFGFIFLAGFVAFVRCALLMRAMGRRILIFRR